MGRNGELSVSAARGRPTPELISPFDSVTPSQYRYSFGIFRLSLTVHKLFVVLYLAGNSHSGPKISFFGDFEPLSVIWY